MCYILFLAKKDFPRFLHFSNTQLKVKHIQTELLSPFRVALTDTRPGVLLRRNSGEVYLEYSWQRPISAHLWGNLQRATRSQRRSEPTTHSVWRSSVWTEKETIKHLTEESEAETEKEKKKDPRTRLFQAAPVRAVRLSLKHTRYHHRTVKLMLYNCSNSTNNREDSWIWAVEIPLILSLLLIN